MAETRKTSEQQRKTDWSVYRQQLGQLLKFVFFESSLAYEVHLNEFLSDLAPYEDIYRQGGVDDELGEFKDMLAMLTGGGGLDGLLDN